VCFKKKNYLGVTFNAMNESALNMLRKKAEEKKTKCKEQGNRKSTTSKVHRSDLHRTFSFMSTNRKGN
jgi:protein subunit release factor A